MPTLLLDNIRKRTMILFLYVEPCNNYAGQSIEQAGIKCLKLQLVASVKQCVCESICISFYQSGKASRWTYILACPPRRGTGCRWSVVLLLKEPQDRLW